MRTIGKIKSKRKRWVDLGCLSLVIILALLILMPSFTKRYPSLNHHYSLYYWDVASVAFAIQEARQRDSAFLDFQDKFEYENYLACNNPKKDCSNGMHLFNRGRVTDWYYKGMGNDFYLIIILKCKVYLGAPNIKYSVAKIVPDAIYWRDNYAEEETKAMNIDPSQINYLVSKFIPPDEDKAHTMYTKPALPCFSGCEEMIKDSPVWYEYWSPFGNGIHTFRWP